MATRAGRRPEAFAGVGYMGDDLQTTGLSALGSLRRQNWPAWSAGGLSYSVKKRAKRWLARARRNIRQMIYRIAEERISLPNSGWKTRAQRKHRLNLLRGPPTGEATVFTGQWRTAVGRARRLMYYIDDSFADDSSLA